MDAGEQKQQGKVNVVVVEPRGTNGGVTLAGLASSVLGGLVVGLAHMAGILLTSHQSDLTRAPSQLVVVLLGGLGGLLGSIVDSILGASFQFSGRDKKTGKIVEVCGEGIEPISGTMILDNHSVNLLSSIITAVTLPHLALSLGL